MAHDCAKYRYDAPRCVVGYGIYDEAMAHDYWHYRRVRLCDFARKKADGYNKQAKG